MLERLKDRLRGGAPAGPRQDTRQRLAATVMVGRDGFLFHRDGHAVAQVTGARPLTPDILDLWVSSIETRKAWCEGRGIAFRFLIVPEKHVVYSDRLPPGTVVSDGRPARQILAGLDAATRASVIYPLAELTAARSVRETYYLGDSHWTTFGALVGFRAMADSLAAERPFHQVPDAEIGWFTRPYIGDLGVRLEPEVEEVADTIHVTSGLEVRNAFQNKLFARGSLLVVETNRPDLPRGVIFRDSFAVNLIPSLAQSFSRLVVVGSQSAHYDLLRAERPDIVISETCERFLGMPDPDQAIELPRDLGGPVFETFSDTSFASFAAGGTIG